MRASLQRIGKSQGVIIPKPILIQVGFERDLELEVANDTVVIRKAGSRPRAGWAEASRAIAASGQDAPVWPDCGTTGL